MTQQATNVHVAASDGLFPDIDTPSLLVDVGRLERNLERMQGIADRAGLNLRPHLKTHKSVEIAERQMALGATGVTVAKPQEAIVFWQGGIRPIFLAYPPVGTHKLNVLTPLFTDGALIVGLDDVRAARPLSGRALTLGVTIPVLFEVDAGMHRVGPNWGQEAAERARLVAQLPGLHLLGIFCHEGHAHSISPEGMPDFAREIARRMASTAHLLESAGHRCDVVSTGSTLTAPYMRREWGVTEIRPGTYVFNDVRTVMSGAASWDDCAVTVLATVVSRPEPARAVIDAGSKIFTTVEEPPYGFGRIINVAGAHLARLSEEHGVLELEDPAIDLRIGDRVRVVPIHVCVTVNMQRELVAVRGDDVVGAIVVDAHLCSR